MRKAQLTFEFLLIFAALLVVISIFFYLSQTSEAGVSQAKVRSEALGTLEDLGSAARQVYAQGAGAKRQVYITIPEGYEPDESYIANQTIKLRVSGNDYAQSEAFSLHGTLPAATGGNWIWVVSEGSGVRIGYGMVDVDKSAITVGMKPKAGSVAYVRVRNIWHSEINLSISQRLAGDVSLEVYPQQATLAPGAEQAFTLTFASGKDAAGFFLGETGADATDGKSSEHIKIPLTVVVQSEGQAQTPPLFVLPSILNTSMDRDSNVTRSFQVCTRSDTSVDSIDIVPSAGAPGNWTSGIEQIGPIGADSCVEKTITITTPEDVGLGTFNGTIAFIGKESSGANASADVAVSIVIGGAPYDSKGPDVEDVLVNGMVFVKDSVNITAKATDDKSAIKECWLRLDGNESALMDADDGTYDNQSEAISLMLEKGISGGMHAAYITCTDARGNVGPVKSVTFRVLKPILFVTLNESMTDSEKAWSEWLGLHHSEAGLSWDFDTATASEVESGSANLSDYAAVAMAEYEENDALKKALDNSHRNLGGYIIFLGKANQKGAYEFCQANTVSTPYPDKDVQVLLNDYYITSPYQMGNLKVFMLDTKMYFVRQDYIGKSLASTSYDEGLTVLGVRGNILSWGAGDPFRLSEEGIVLTTRAIDFALLYATKQ